MNYINQIANSITEDPDIINERFWRKDYKNQTLGQLYRTFEKKQNLHDDNECLQIIEIIENKLEDQITNIKNDIENWDQQIENIKQNRRARRDPDSDAYPESSWTDKMRLDARRQDVNADSIYEQLLGEIDKHMIKYRYLNGELKRISKIRGLLAEKQAMGLTLSQEQIDQIGNLHQIAKNKWLRAIDMINAYEAKNQVAKPVNLADTARERLQAQRRRNPNIKHFETRPRYEHKPERELE